MPSDNGLFPEDGDDVVEFAVSSGGRAFCNVVEFREDLIFRTGCIGLFL